MLNTADTVPVYPGPLPGGVNPNLIIPLQGLTPEAARLFMGIEYPESGPVELADRFNTIGEFYAAIRTAFDTLQPTLSGDGQLTGPLGLSVIETPTQVTQAIDLIRIQGEGSATSPEEAPSDLAHYYRFGEVYHGRRFVFDGETGSWGYNGAALPFPDVWPMGVVPEGGYTQDQVSSEVWALRLEFDQSYTEMINQLHTAWAEGNQDTLRQAIIKMFSLESPAVSLMQIQIPDSESTYGPCFRLM